jgi:hypothetical protein
VLEETATSPLGGCIGFSDRFIAGFYFLHALGMVGEAGWHQINRQARHRGMGTEVGWDWRWDSG